MYDAIVIGARCAGSPTAMLLARRGYRVLLVDRAAFPSDTLSTHYIHQPGTACLERWGLLGQVAASNCPPARRLRFDVGPFALVGTPPPADGVREAYAPRRFVLDRILVEAAVAAGAELRERFTVDALLWDGDRVVGIRGRSAGGVTVQERARIVIGADGLHSLVARSVDAPTYAAAPALTCAYYTYWGGLSLEGAELYPRPGRMVIVGPTNDGQAIVYVAWPRSEFGRVRTAIESSFHASLELVPSLAERARAGERTERFRGTADLPFFLRRPHGPGWALVGDAGYHRDPITAGGISDAFRHAELLTEALTAGFERSRPLGRALADYEAERNGRLFPLYELTRELAALEPPPPELERLLGALPGDQEQIDRFFGTIAGTTPIPEFYAPENVDRIASAQAA